MVMIKEYEVNGVVYRDELPDVVVPKSAEIEEIKKELAKYDYIGNKIATGCATIEEYAPQIAHCQELRKRINELESMEGENEQ